ncbi:MAG TPA: ribosome maturation factor RimP [Candidatus Polarisedimenticolia bacterium]
MTRPAASIPERVRSLAVEVTSRTGYELVDVEYRSEPGGWTLRLFIDKEGGVNLDDCRRVSEEFGAVLEVEDPIPNPFNLEVSSPGLDRPLTRDGDYVAAQGKLVRITTREPISGRRNFRGRLLSATTEPASTHLMEAGGATGDLMLVLRDDAGAEQRIPARAVERARLVYEWPAPNNGKKGRRAGSTHGQPGSGTETRR